MPNTCEAIAKSRSALFVLYEYMLSSPCLETAEQLRIVQAIEETSARALMFAESTHKTRFENHGIDTQSPYLMYSLFQAAVVQYSMWQRDGILSSKARFDTLVEIIEAFQPKWSIASTCRF
jgi:hypothetical protein